MGTHREARSPLARIRHFRQRRQYKRILAALLEFEPQPVSAERRAQLEKVARRAAELGSE